MRSSAVAAACCSRHTHLTLLQQPERERASGRVLLLHAQLCCCSCRCSCLLQQTHAPHSAVAASARACERTRPAAACAARRCACRAAPCSRRRARQRGPAFCSRGAPACMSRRVSS
jgi:hypothetical protein